MLIKKDREVLSLRSQVSQLSDELNRALRALQDRDMDNRRLSSVISDMRDSTIQRDLELTSLKQTLGNTQAQSSRVESQTLNALHLMRQERDGLAEALEEERQRSFRLAEEKNKYEHELRATLDRHHHQEEDQKRCAEVQKLEAMAKEEAWERKVEEMSRQLLSKGRDADASLSALHSAIEEAKELQASSSKALADRDIHIKELQGQVQMLSETESSRSSRIGSLVTSFNEIRVTCEKQAREISQLNIQLRNAEGDKERMKERVKEMTNLSANLKVEKDRLAADLNAKNAKLHAASMELTISQHQAREAGIRSHGRYHGDEEEVEEESYYRVSSPQSKRQQEEYPSRELLKADLMLKKLLSQSPSHATRKTSKTPPAYRF